MIQVLLKPKGIRKLASGYIEARRWRKTKQSWFCFSEVQPNLRAPQGEKVSANLEMNEVRKEPLPCEPRRGEKVSAKPEMK